MQTELESIVKTVFPIKKYLSFYNELDIKLAVYFIMKCIENKDLKRTPVSLTEFTGYLLEQGYTKEKAKSKAYKTLAKFERLGFLSSRFEFQEEKLVDQYYPGLLIIAIGNGYLERHPEITGVKK